MKEKLMQDLIVNFPSEILDEPGLSYLQREVKTGNNRLDIVLLDRRGRHLLVEVQRGSLDTKHIDRHIDYSEGYLADHETTDIRILYIATHIDIHRKNFLQRRGYEYKEISEAKFREVALGHGFTLDAEVLLEQSTPLESIRESLATDVKSKNKEKWDGYLRQNGISESGNSKQAQALSLFINGTTEEDYKKALPEYSKGFNVMLKFFIDNGFTSSVVDGKTFLKKSLLSASDKGIDPAQERRNREPRYSNTSHFCRLPYTEKQNYRIDKALENFNSIEELAKSTGCTEQRIKSHIRYILKNCPHAVQEERGGKIRFVLKDLHEQG